MPNIGDVVSDKYRIIQQLGAGAMGVVFLALHLDTEKQVALKWLNPAITSVPTSVERFKREAKATGRIHHPNVVSVHDWGEHDGELYIVMEYLPGQTLRAFLSAVPQGRLSVVEALGLLFPIMRGIAAAHVAGVLHRDLKPENVLLAESPDGLQPIPKVLDFGLAKVRNATNFSAKLSLPGSVLGTYHYMAPEQLRGDGELDERSDVYALGAMLYEMLSGGPPYHAVNPIDLVLQMHATEPPSLNDVGLDLSAELSQVVGIALARDPASRYPTVEAFAAELEPFVPALRFRGDGSRPGAEPTVPPRAMKRSLVQTLAPKGLSPQAQPDSSGASIRGTEGRLWWRLGLVALTALMPPTGSFEASVNVAPVEPESAPGAPERRVGAPQPVQERPQPPEAVSGVQQDWVVGGQGAPTPWPVAEEAVEATVAAELPDAGVEQRANQPRASKTVVPAEPVRRHQPSGAIVGRRRQRAAREQGGRAAREQGGRAAKERSAAHSPGGEALQPAPMTADQF